ncbi:MAG: group 1 glycosyl transferase [Proteobacteria bacterium]|nr:group 1 glycosyl transferase [Pseudomonadota bacterium]
MTFAFETSPGLKTPRRLRILWASVYCLLDTTSGAAMAVREMLRQLALREIEIEVLGATVFDDERGQRRIAAHMDFFKANLGAIVKVEDELLTHRLLVTASTQRDTVTSRELGLLFQHYQNLLESFRPDLVFFYGGQTQEYLIADEAKQRGIPVIAYLANGRFQGKWWCRNVDLILCDSLATARFYAETQSYAVTPIGAFINPGQVIPAEHSRQHILFVNPTLEKGVAVLIQLALMLEQRRPDIVFEVVESRGGFADILRRVSSALGDQRESLANVIVTPNTDDMRPVYSRARLIIVPSLCWDSGARVLAEAMLNGIPAIVTDHGGSPEMIQDGGLKFALPPEFHTPPYDRIPLPAMLEPLVEAITRFFDDPGYYLETAQRAMAVGQTLHKIDTSTQRLLQAIEPWLAKRVGNAVTTGEPMTFPTVRAAQRTPKISIIFPVGNREVYLREAIESILAQTFTDFELLIVADGIEPSVMSILESYHDERIHLIRLPLNMGICAASNTALSAARAPYMALMDSDDVAQPHRLATQYEWMESHPQITVCASNAVKILEDGSRVSMQYPELDGIIKARLMIVDSAILNPTAIFRSEFVHRHRLRYDANFTRDGDHRFFVDMLRCGAVFHGLQEELLTYRRHFQNATNDMTGFDDYKTRIREMLAPVFFPELTGVETAVLLAAFRSDFSGHPEDVHRSLAAVDKAMLENRSFMDEDRAELNNILSAVRNGLTKHLAGAQ